MHKNQRAFRLIVSSEKDVSLELANEGSVSESIAVEAPKDLPCEVYGRSTVFHNHDSHKICYMYEGSVLCAGKDCFQFSKEKNSIVPITREQYDAISAQLAIAA